MIHDKDYMMRMVRQFSEFLSKLILGNNEGKSEDLLLVFETQMKDVFKMDFETLSVLPFDEINAIVLNKEEKHQPEYYELLGHLFYYKFKENPTKDLAEKANNFYQLYLEKSQIFSIPVIQRLGELKGIS